MKQLFLSKRGTPVVVDVPTPLCGSHSLLVATRLSVVSTGTETKSLRVPFTTKHKKQRDLVHRAVEVVREEGLDPLLRKVRDRDNIGSPLGYSAAGVVIEVGRAVSGFVVGQTVACAGAGFANHAEINQVPALLASGVPPGVDLADAAWTTLGAIAVQGVRRVMPQIGECVVVIGLGVLGLLTVQILRANGCQVVGLDIERQRIELGRQLGAQVALHAGDPLTHVHVANLTHNLMADAVIICATTGDNRPLTQALRLVRKRGRVVLVGDVEIRADRAAFYEKEVEFTLSCSYGPGRYDPDYELYGKDYPAPFVRWTENRNMEAFLSLLADKAVQIQPLRTHRFDINQADSALAVAADPTSGALGVEISYPENTAESHKSGHVIHLTSGSTKVITPPRTGKLTLACIGLGSFATTTLLPVLCSDPRVVLRYAISSRGNDAVQKARTFGAENAATDWRPALSDPAVDAVVIATRHDTHAQLAEAALRAHKHVFVEKPLAIDSPGVAAVLNAQKDTGCVLAVGHNRRFAPPTKLLANTLAPLPGPMIIQYRVNAGFIPADHWTQNLHTGGGRIIGETCHFIDLCRFLVGDRVDVVQIHSAAVPVSGQTPDCLDNVVITMTFADGSLASILYTSAGPKELPKEKIEVFRAGTAFMLNDFCELTSVGPHAIAPWRSRRPQKGHREEVASFLAAISGAPSDLPSPTVAAFPTIAAIMVDQHVRRSQKERKETP